MFRIGRGVDLSWLRTRSQFREDCSSEHVYMCVCLNPRYVRQRHHTYGLGICPQDMFTLALYLDVLCVVRHLHGGFTFYLHRIRTVCRF